MEATAESTAARVRGGALSVSADAFTCAKFLSRISVALLKPIGLFLICNVPREAVRAPFGGSAETGAGGVRGLLVPNLLNGGFGYENYLRFCPAVALHHWL